jgi:hypothetical protein
MANKTKSIEIYIADMLNAGVEPGVQSIAIKPDKSRLWFAYAGPESGRDYARLAIFEYLQAMWLATDIEFHASQYARSRFKFYASFNTSCAIDPTRFNVQKTDLSKF